MASGYHTTRFSFDPRREVLWKTLCEAYFQRLVPSNGCVLELGAGYGHFINNIRCARRIAVDEWPGMLDHLAPGVEPIVGPVTDLTGVENGTVDFAFASNLFEHLTQDAFTHVLEQLSRKLKPGGTLNIVQPNYRLAYREYFDDYTHVSVYSDRTLRDFLTAHGFQVLECRPRFLPFTIKSRLPIWPPLIRLYLVLPFKPFAGQMWVRATPADGMGSGQSGRSSPPSCTPKTSH